MGKRAKSAMLVAAVAAILATLSTDLGPLSGTSVAAQAPGPADTGGLAFEVASVKANNSRDGERNGNIVGRRFVLTYATLRDLIQFAYQRPDGILRNDREIAGGPSWITSDHFDIAATTSSTGPMPVGLDAAATAAGAATSAEIAAIDRVRFMMRALLVDRFKLVVHNESRALPIYTLVRARTDGALGPQFRKVNVDCAALRAAGRPLPTGPADTPCGGFRKFGPGHHAGHAVSMSLVTNLLEGSVDRRVFDRTGLTGWFDVDLRWTPDQPQRTNAADSPPADLNGPSIFTAVREQLGLKLEATEGPIDVLVIDRAEKPTPN